MASSSVRAPRRLAPALAVGVVLAVACGRESSNEPRGEATRAIAQELAASYYLGTGLAAKQLVFTFDDGPGPVTADLSTYLKAQNVPGTFFVNGACIAATGLPNPAGCGAPTPNAAAILAQIAADGHLLANHTTTHRSLPGVPANQREQELSETDGYIAPYTPWNRFLFRPPYGDWSVGVFDTLKTTSMNKYVGPIYWDIGGGPTNATRAADWECWQNAYTSKQCGDLYLTEARAIGKGIILTHDPYGNTSNHNLTVGTGNTVDMVKYITPILKAEGFTFRSLYDVPSIAAALPTCNASCATCAGAAANQCTSCAAGSFLSGGSCTPCTTTCGAGTYRSAACSPTANAVCSPCATCAAGSYASAACTGTTNTVCTTCTACAAGSYASTACAGATNTACTACTACAAGTYASTVCAAATNTVCAACHANCTTCSGPTAADCGSCPAGSYLSGSGCQTCDVCPAGTYQDKACSTTANTSCAPCAAGTFSAAGAATTCAPCGSCDDGDACTSDACSATKGCTNTPVPGCGASSSGSSGASSSSSSGASSGGNVDAGESSSSSSGGAPDPQTGCSASGASPGSLSWVMGALGLMLVRRTSRRRGERA